MTDFCHASIINDEGWTDYCDKPATGTADYGDGFDDYQEYPACDEHKER